MKLPLTLSLAAALLAPADSARATEPTAGPVMEIVTYRLKPGVDHDAYLAAARATEAFLRDTGAVTARALTVDADGTWTDIIQWTSMDAAKAAEAEAMQRPEFGAFFDAFDPDSTVMRHAEIVWQME
ncbi:MAG: hypothetical protein AAGK37_05545 [Pseudomonadota bacterium]